MPQYRRQTSGGASNSCRVSAMDCPPCHHLYLGSAVKGIRSSPEGVRYGWVRRWSISSLFALSFSRSSSVSFSLGFTANLPSDEGKSEKPRASRSWISSIVVISIRFLRRGEGVSLSSRFHSNPRTPPRKYLYILHFQGVRKIQTPLRTHSNPRTPPSPARGLGVRLLGRGAECRVRVSLGILSVAQY